MQPNKILVGCYNNLAFGLASSLNWPLCNHGRNFHQASPALLSEIWLKFEDVIKPLAEFMVVLQGGISRKIHLHPMPAKLTDWFRHAKKWKQGQWENCKKVPYSFSQLHASSPQKMTGSSCTLRTYSAKLNIAKSGQRSSKSFLSKFSIVWWIYT